MHIRVRLPSPRKRKRSTSCEYAVPTSWRSKTARRTPARAFPPRTHARAHAARALARPPPLARPPHPKDGRSTPRSWPTVFAATARTPLWCSASDAADATAPRWRPRPRRPALLLRPAPRRRARMTSSGRPWRPCAPPPCPCPTPAPAPPPRTRRWPPRGAWWCPPPTRSPPTPAAWRRWRRACARSSWSSRTGSRSRTRCSPRARTSARGCTASRRMPTRVSAPRCWRWWPSRGTRTPSRRAASRRRGRRSSPSTPSGTSCGRRLRVKRIASSRRSVSSPRKTPP